MSWTDKPCILGKSRNSRRIWKQLYGDPGKLWVLHRCNQVRCWEPSHFYLGTVADNHRDMMIAGRSTKGKPGRKLTPEEQASISARMVGIVRGPLTPVHRAKISTALMGRKLTLEQRARLSKARAQRGPIRYSKRSKCVGCGKNVRPDRRFILIYSQIYHPLCAPN